jgi:poly(3-hydroxybutyrate) depolymerase
LLGFHGGGEDMYEFLRYTEFNLINEQIIIFNGQVSANTYTYQSAFPWLFANGASQYQNDIDFVDTVITKFFENKLKKIFLTAKSDGAGFCILLSNLSKYKKKIKAIGMCSGAHFGLYNINNIGPYNSNNKFIGLYKTIIPYNIITPPKNISIFLMHGTEDTVMPYDGQEFPGSSDAIDFLKITLWRVIDPEIINLFNLDIIKTQTFTPDIPNYVQNIIKYSKINNLYSSTTVEDKYTLTSYNNSCNNVLNFFTIDRQDHDWSGHPNSGPNSNRPANFHLDATYLLIKFFDFDIGKYKTKIDIIPTGFLNYKGQPVTEN